MVPQGDGPPDAPPRGPSLAELDGPDDDDIPMWVVDKFDQADFDALADYALRNTPLPAASQHEGARGVRVFGGRQALRRGL